MNRFSSTKCHVRFFGTMQLTDVKNNFWFFDVSFEKNVSSHKGDSFGFLVLWNGCEFFNTFGMIYLFLRHSGIFLKKKSFCEWVSPSLS